MTKDLSLSRRQLLAGTSALGAAAVWDGHFGSALAKAPMLGTQAPYFYRFKLGDAEATIVSDGPLPLGDPHDELPRPHARRRWTSSSPTISCRSTTPCSSRTRSIVNTGDRLILFDTGMGSLKHFRADDRQADDQPASRPASIRRTSTPW